MRVPRGEKERGSGKSLAIKLILVLGFSGTVLLTTVLVARKVVYVVLPYIYNQPYGLYNG